MKKILVVVSNHNPNQWAVEQKEGWDDIVYFQFPNIPASATRDDVKKLVTEYIEKIEKALHNKQDVYFCIQGEYLFTILLINKLLDHFSIDKFIFPTTERCVVEIQKEDGSVEKISRFKFVRWR